MIKLNRYKYRIEGSDKILAEKNNWNGTENTYIGNLGEIAVSVYLGMDEQLSEHKAMADIIDDEGNRVQVKAVKEAFEKGRFWLENKTTLNFDRYIFCAIDENEKFVVIEADMVASIAHSNSHIFNGLKGIYRR